MYLRPLKDIGKEVSVSIFANSELTAKKGSTQPTTELWVLMILTLIRSKTDHRSEWKMYLF